MREPMPGRPRAAAVAVFVTFVCNGFNVGGWAARLPAVRDELSLSPNRVGLLLLVGASGSLVALPLSGLIVQRLGARRAVLAFAGVNTAGLLVAALGVAASSVLLTGAGLVCFAAGIGVWDAAMNLEGAAVEQRLSRSIMPRFHAGFSLGTVAGAGVAALAAKFDVSLLAHFSVSLTLSLVGVFVCVRYYLPEGTHSGAPRASSSRPRTTRSAMAVAAWRERRTLLIGLMVLAAGLTEGAAADWASLAVVDGFGTTAEIGAIGFGVFVAAMTGMRLLGTGLLDRWGRVAVLRVNAGISLVGIAAFTLAPSLGLALVGVALWGMGASLGFPVGMSAAADEQPMAPARIAVVSTVGYSAFLAGPPLMGMLAEHVGYRHALLALALPLALGLLVAGAARPLRPADPEGRSPALERRGRSRRLASGN